MDGTFVYRNPETAAPADGPLRGVNIAIQPGLSVAGWPTDAGSAALADFTALEDATIAARLRAAGAHLCGSTAMSEFGFGLHGSRAGGALRQGEADAELVPDLAGESRLAALAAGVCGFKPSYGLVSRLGLVGLIPSMEGCGLLSASIDTIRRILQAVAGPDPLDFSMPEQDPPDFAPQAIDPSRTTIGVIAESASGLASEEAALFRAAEKQLQDAGFAVQPLSLPEFALFSTVHDIVGSVEASSCAGRYDSVRYGRRAPGARNWNEMYLRSRSAAFGTLVKSYLFQGAFFQFEHYAAFEDACRIRARLVAGMDRLASRVDFLLLPAFDRAPGDDPPGLADIYARFAGTLFANVAGLPALVLPTTPGAAGLQLTASRYGDGRLLALGEHLHDLRRGGNA